MTSEQQTVSPWQPIGTAPRSNGRWDSKTVKIDILAKRWVLEDDRFEFERFTDCYWDREHDNWTNIPHGTYRAVAWMPIPVIPKEYP